MGDQEPEGPDSDQEDADLELIDQEEGELPKDDSPEAKLEAGMSEAGPESADSDVELEDDEPGGAQ